MSGQFRTYLSLVERHLRWSSVLLNLLFHVCHPSGSFHPVKMDNGFLLCAVDEPSFSSLVDDIVGMPSGVPNSVRCAYRCTTKNSCSAFNAIGSECHFYNSTLNHCFAASTTCVYYQVFCDRQTPTCMAPKVANPVVSAQSCSFPFTLNGQLYYQCVANYSATCDVGCFLPGRQWATCTFESVGFTARNTTVNVVINGIAVPLMNVNGWLTIMTNIGGNFPQRQSYDAYKAGFGDISSNFWLGLINVNTLTSLTMNGGYKYRLRFELLASIDHRWYSEEYDWFYIDSLSENFAFRVSPSATGDAGDSLNIASSTTSGNPFTMSGTQCSDASGPFWYTSAGSCNWWNAFQSTPVWNDGPQSQRPGSLQVARMMVRQNA